MRARDLLTIVLGLVLLVLGIFLFSDAVQRMQTNHSLTYKDGTILSVNVRGDEWAVFIADKGDKIDKTLSMAGFLALTVCDKDHQIFVTSGMNYFIQRETIFHELLHAATCADGEAHNDYFNSANDGEHPGLDRIAAFSISLFHDNPELARYIIGR